MTMDYEKQLNGPEGTIIKLVWMTPEMVVELLKVNTDNRPERRNHVNRIAADMDADLYLFNGATVVITNTGKLADGQHRLEAIVKSGRPQWILLVTGISEAAMSTVDNNISRSLSDILGLAHAELRGGTDKKLAGALHHVLGYALSYQNLNRFSGKALDGIALRDPRLLKAVRDVEESNNVSSMIPVTMTAAVLYLGGLVNQESTKHFLDQLHSGIGFVVGTEPASALRSYLIKARERTSKSKSNPRLLPKAVMWAVIFALAKHMSGQSIKLMRPQGPCLIPGVSRLLVKTNLGIVQAVGEESEIEEVESEVGIDHSSTPSAHGESDNASA